MKVYREGVCIISELIIADNFFGRACGLLFKKPLQIGEGLLIRPCNSVHTCFMRYPIDVVYLNENNEVTKIVEHMMPWRLSFDKNARSVIEVSSLTKIKAQVNAGDTLKCI